MGSFRSPQSRRQQDIATLTDADRPRRIKAADWLQPGEWIRYWAILPHSAVTAMVGAGTTAIFDERGRQRSVRYDAGAAIQARLVHGIIDWRLIDDQGTEVPWSIEQAGLLLDGLPTAVHGYLTNAIGAKAPHPPLGGPDKKAKVAEGQETPTLGEASAES